jgi:antitoxin ParD1/3/4
MDGTRDDNESRQRETLEVEILKGIQSGESTLMTADDWAEIRREICKSVARRREE